FRALRWHLIACPGASPPFFHTHHVQVDRGHYVGGFITNRAIPSPLMVTLEPTAPPAVRVLTGTCLVHAVGANTIDVLQVGQITRQGATNYDAALVVDQHIAAQMHATTGTNQRRGT